MRNGRALNYTNLLSCYFCSLLYRTYTFLNVMPRYELLSVAEVALQLSRRRGFVYKELKRKRLPYYQIGGKIAISQRDLDDYLSRSRVAALGERETRKTVAK